MDDQRFLRIAAGSFNVNIHLQCCRIPADFDFDISDVEGILTVGQHASKHGGGQRKVVPNGAVVNSVPAVSGVKEVLW